MTAAIKKANPPTWHSNVGLRELPFSGQEYYARAPKKFQGDDDQEDERKNGIFNTVWLPVNASNRVVVDKQQDIMHMKYSYINEKRLRTHAPTSQVTPANVTHDNFLNTLKSRRTTRARAPLPISYELARTPLPKIELELKPAEVPEHVKIAMWKTGHNTMAPFASLGKPTCGYFFTRNVSHKKRLIGINATNTVKWRSNVDILNIKKSVK